MIVSRAEGEVELTPKKQPERPKRTIAAKVIQTAGPKLAFPPTLELSILCFAMTNTAISKTKARREKVAAKEAKQVVKAVPANPRMWARSPKMTLTSPKAAAIGWRTMR
jgi:hypothetical protein